MSPGFKTGKFIEKLLWSSQIIHRDSICYNVERAILVREHGLRLDLDTYDASLGLDLSSSSFIPIPTVNPSAGESGKCEIRTSTV